jgi:hypothetical protein
MLYSFNGAYPAPLPFRITLPNGFTRTEPVTFTEAEIASAGFTGPYTEPAYNPNTEQLEWTDGAFVIAVKPPGPPEPDPVDLSIVATGILAAAAAGDADSLATLLGELLKAARST